MTKYRVTRMTSFRISRGKSAAQLGEFEADSPEHALEQYFNKTVAKEIPRNKLQVSKKFVKFLGYGEYSIPPYIIIDVNEHYGVKIT